MGTPWVVVLSAVTAAFGSWWVPDRVRCAAPRPEATRAAGTLAPLADARRVGPGGAVGSIAGLRWLRPVAVLTGAGAADLLAVRFGADPVLVLLVPLVPVGFTLAVIDGQAHLLPTRIIVPSTLAALLFVVAEWTIAGDRDPLIRAVLGFAAAHSFFWVGWRLSRGGVGFGDVRLAGLGLVTARVGWSPFSVAFAVGLAAASVYGLLWTRASRGSREPVPIGPFLLAGALLGLFA